MQEKYSRHGLGRVGMCGGKGLGWDSDPQQEAGVELVTSGSHARQRRWENGGNWFCLFVCLFSLNKLNFKKHQARDFVIFVCFSLTCGINATHLAPTYPAGGPRLGVPELDTVPPKEPAV